MDKYLPNIFNFQACNGLQFDLSASIVNCEITSHQKQQTIGKGGKCQSMNNSSQCYVGTRDPSKQKQNTADTYFQAVLSLLPDMFNYKQ